MLPTEWGLLSLKTIFNEFRRHSLGGLFKQSMHVVIFFEQHFELTNQALFIEIWNVS